MFACPCNGSGIPKREAFGAYTPGFPQRLQMPSNKPSEQVASSISARSLLAFDSAEPCVPAGNALLAQLPPSELERVCKHLQPLWLSAGGAAIDASAPEQHALFPVHSIVSLQSVLECGSAVEFASVGKEGCLVPGPVLGGSHRSWRAVVHTGGLAYALPADRLQDEFLRQGMLPRLLLRHGGALLAQAAMVAICNRRHTLEQQLCRWFLLTLDRLPGNGIATTQEAIATILGVRRESITQVVGLLQREGLIERRRGHVGVLRRDALQERACECYRVVRAEFDRLAD